MWTRRSTPSPSSGVRWGAPALALRTRRAGRRADRTRRHEQDRRLRQVTAAPCCTGRATSTSWRPARRRPTWPGSPANSSPGRWKVTSTPSTGRRRSTPTYWVRQGLAEYRRLASEAWAKLPPITGEARERHESAGDYGQLMRIMDIFAERDGDVESRIALRAKNLSSTWSYLQLVEFCREHGRQEEALRWAEEGLWVFEDDRSERAARPRRRRASFEGRQGRGRGGGPVAGFRKGSEPWALCAASQVGRRTARDRALELLDRPGWSARSATRWAPPAAFIRILMHEKMFRRRLGIPCASTQTSMGLKDLSPEPSEATRPRESARGLCRARRPTRPGGGGNSAYAEAAEFIVAHGRLAGAAEQMGLRHRAQGALWPQAQLHEAVGVRACGAPRSSKIAIFFDAKANSAWRPPTLFASDAEWGEGLDHAGGDRADV